MEQGMIQAQAAGHAQIVSLFADLADDPMPAPVQQDVADRTWTMAAFLVGAIARDLLGDPQATERALRRALALARPDQVLVPFLSRPRTPARGLAALTRGETRVLQYLPTNLSTPEIAEELFLSVNTVKTHQRHLYQKLGARSRTQAVRQARAFGLLSSPSGRR
jgi:LuxR family transcriptional regulator, maltose regulon positive regulatory protein